MAYAAIENSPRLKATLAALKAAPSGLTGRDLCIQANIMNPGECTSELRKQGYEIACTEEARSAAGRRVFRYCLTGEPSTVERPA